MIHKSHIYLLASLLLLLGACPGICPAQIGLNPAFGNSGKLRITIDEYNDAVALQTAPNGDLLLLANTGHLAGQFDMNISLLRLDSAGNVDPGFGAGGIATCDFPGADYSEGRALLALPDGKILVAGIGYPFAQTQAFPCYLMRFHPDGTPDSTFGQNGVQAIRVLGTQESPEFLRMDSNGKILLGGSTLDTLHGHASAPFLTRLLANGQPDSSFAGTGVLLIEPDSAVSPLKTLHSTGGILYDITEMPDGGLVAAGGGANGDNLDILLTRLTTSGALDTSFYQGGFLRYPFSTGTNNQAIRSIGLADGTMIYGANSQQLQGREFLIGSVDSQGSHQLQSLNFGGKESILEDLIQVGSGFAAAGRVIEPAHNSAVYEGDYFGITWHPRASQPGVYTQLEVDFDSLRQDGARCLAATPGGNLVAAGFVRTDTASRIDIALVGLLPPAVGRENPGDLQPAITVYPNPADDRISFSGIPVTGKSWEVTWVNEMGQVIQQDRLPAESISTRHLPDGFYQVIFFQESGFHSTKKIIIRH